MPFEMNMVIGGILAIILIVLGIGCMYYAISKK